MFRKVIFLIVFFSLLAFSRPSLVTADVSVIRGSDGTMYLSANDISTKSAATVSATTTQKNTNPDGKIDIANTKIPEGFYNNLSVLINQVLRFIMLLAALLSFTYMLWGGFDWITSGGDKGKVQSARSKITAAVICLILVSASYAILNIVLRFLGFESLDAVFMNIRVTQ